MKVNKKKGFTLIELIASIAIFSIVLTAVYSVLSSGNSIYINGVKKEDVQSSARLSISTISQAIKTSRVCILADSNAKFSSIDVGTNGKKLLYVEGTDNSRYMYVIKVVNGVKELHKLKFSNAGLQKYSFSPPIYEQVITDADKNIYNKADNAPNKVALANVSDRIFIDSSVNFATTYSVADTARNCYYLLYESYGDRCYLWAKKQGIDYKIKLTPVDNSDYTIIKDDMITGYIDDISVTADAPVVDMSVSVTNQNIYKLNIDVKTVDKDKTKELTTSSYILNYRGGM